MNKDIISTFETLSNSTHNLTPEELFRNQPKEIFSAIKNNDGLKLRELLSNYNPLADKTTIFQA
jgi:hypothetical protein